MWDKRFITAGLFNADADPTNIIWTTTSKVATILNTLGYQCDPEPLLHKHADHQCNIYDGGLDVHARVFSLWGQCPLIF